MFPRNAFQHWLLLRIPQLERLHGATPSANVPRSDPDRDVHGLTIKLLKVARLKERLPDAPSIPS